MNERFQELHNQARDFYLQDEYMDLSMKDLHRLVESKFAELIVKECEVALSPMLRDMVSRGQAYDLIKKHFGVDDNIAASESLHSDKGYSLGTPEAQEAFDSKRGYKL